MTTPPIAGASKNRLIILAVVLVVGGAFLAWRFLSNSGPAIDPAAAAAEQALQDQIQREGLDAPPEQTEPLEAPVKTRAATKLDGSE